MYICVDFDGTVVDHRFPKIGQAAPDAIHWLQRWQELGARIILWTMRSPNPEYPNVLQDAVEYLESRGVHLYGVNENPDQKTWSTSPKAYAPIYVDDAAFGCPLVEVEDFARPCVNWAVVGPAIETILSSSHVQAEVAARKAATSSSL